MSKSTEIKYICPYCKKEFDTDIYQAVNAQSDPDLRERCMSGDIFRHSCPHCHTDFMIQSPLLYEDKEHQFVLLVSSEEAGEGFVSYTKPLSDKGYTLRRCSTIKEFTEKIQILEDGVDDILVELAKYDSFIDFLNSRKGKAEDVTSVDYAYTKEDVMKIDIRMDDKGMSFLIPLSALKEEMEAEKDYFAVENEKFPCVNAEWMISLFTPKE